MEMEKKRGSGPSPQCWGLHVGREPAGNLNVHGRWAVTPRYCLQLALDFCPREQLWTKDKQEKPGLCYKGHSCALCSGLGHPSWTQSPAGTSQST